MFFIPKYFENMSLLKKYIITYPFYIICTVFFLIANPMTTESTIYLYWIWAIFIGIATGVLCIATEICLLELQPKKHVGKINGLKTLFRYGFLAATTALIAFYWEINNHIWFWYFQAFTFIFGLISVTIVINIKIIIYLCDNYHSNINNQSSFGSF
eukprot:538393_1